MAVNVKRSAIHEAGHTIAAIATGSRIAHVHIGHIWYQGEYWKGQDCTNALIDMTKDPTALGHVDRWSRDTEKLKNATIKVSGFMGESMWPSKEFIPTRNRMEFLTQRRYAADRSEVENDLYSELCEAFDYSEQLLRDNSYYFVKLARIFNAKYNHTFFEPELLALCDIWALPEDPNSRFSRDFKWAAGTWKVVEEKDAPANCPFKKAAIA